MTAKRGGAARPRDIGASAALFLAALLAGTLPARAEFKLFYPIIDYREIEFEHNGSTTFDRAKSGKSNNQSYTNEVEIGATTFWKVGLEGEWAAPSGENLRYEATTLENFFQLTPQGKYWADVGFFAEYSHAASRADADAITFGPMAQKEVPDLFGQDTLHTLNLFFGKEVGRNRSDATPLFFSWQSRLRLHPQFEPGIELYSVVDDIAAPGKFANQQHRIGPIFAGIYPLYRLGKIEYEVGYLVGLTRAAEKGAVRWRFEYEIPF